MMASRANSDIVTPWLSACRRKTENSSPDSRTLRTAAGGLAAKAQEVAKAAADKKAELTARWDELQAGIPQMLEGLKSRLDILAEAKKLPADLTKEKLAELQSAYDEAAKQFEEAKAAAGEDLAKAVEAGAAIKAKAIEIAGALGLTLANS